MRFSTICSYILLISCLSLWEIGELQQLDKYTNDYQTLLKTIYAEARGEPEEGQRAVAWVIKNRVDQNKPRRFGSTIADVCKKPWQFSCWNGVSDIGMYETDARDAIDLWLPNVFLGYDNTGGADHYINPDLANPSWIRNCDTTVKIGKHQFYDCP